MSPPVATGADARAAIDFANGLVGDLPPAAQPAAFGAFMTGLRLGIALGLTDAAWAQSVDDELSDGVAEERPEQRRMAAWAIAQMRRRAAAYRCLGGVRPGDPPPSRDQTDGPVLAAVKW
jgi:hypothetical protein